MLRGRVGRLAFRNPRQVNKIYTPALLTPSSSSVRFSVLEGSFDAFEERFANRNSILTDFKGFRGFLLLRRDGAKKPGDGGEPDDGFTHSTFSVWDDKACFEAWRDSEKKPPPPAADNGSGPPAVRPNIFVRPPDATFYEGILALESAKGV